MMILWVLFQAFWIFLCVLSLEQVQLNLTKKRNSYLIFKYVVWLWKSILNGFDVAQYVLFCTIICIIFTSLCKNFVKLTWVLAEAFRCHGHHFQCLTEFNKVLAKWSENNTYYSARSRWTKQQHCSTVLIMPSHHGAICYLYFLNQCSSARWISFSDGSTLLFLI